MSMDEIRNGDRVKDANGKVYKVVAIEKDGSLKLAAKGITSKTSPHTVAKSLAKLIADSKLTAHYRWPPVPFSQQRAPWIRAGNVLVANFLQVQPGGYYVDSERPESAIPGPSQTSVARSAG